MNLVEWCGNFTKSKSIFPTDDAIRKVIYMSVTEISKKWTMPVRDWGLAYAQFVIYFTENNIIINIKTIIVVNSQL